MGCGQSIPAEPAKVVRASITAADLMKQDDSTSKSIINLLASDPKFARLSAAEGKDIIKRDEEDETKLAAGIKIAVEKGILVANPAVSPTVPIEVAGKSAEDVAGAILSKLTKKEGNVLILQGLSGTGKGTTVKKLQEKLPNCVCWSNGNIFRSFTHMATKHCEEKSIEFSSEVLTPELLESFSKRMEYKKFDDGFDVVLDGKVRVSEIQNTVLKLPVISSRVPTVAEKTQGEVVNFASKAIDVLKANGCNVILEGRAQTLNYIPSDNRFELVMSDPALLGSRRGAQRVMARAQHILGANAATATSEQVEAAVREATTELVGRTNTALVFIKPHAQVAGIADFVEKEFSLAGIKIAKRGELTGPEISKNGTIDSHYAAIGQYAMKTLPKDLPVPASKKEEFKAKFNEDFDEAAASGKMINTAQAMANYNISGPEVGKEFEKGKTTSGMIKLMPGCYVAYIQDREIYIINGFYGSMRAEYVEATAKVSWYLLEWNELKLSWTQFRRDVLGATDPTAAVPSSIRAKILNQAESLNLGFVPTTSKNCVHGSASPLEAFNERRIWTGATSTTDAFSGALLNKFSVTAQNIDWFCTNPTIGGKPLFDLVEDQNTTPCLNILAKLSKQ
jgi:cytidylate kinase